MRHSFEPSFTVEEVKEAFEDILEPEIVVQLLSSYTERKKAIEEEVARINRMIDIVDECDEAIQLDQDGGVVHPDSILDASIQYLASLKNTDVIDDLDEKARVLSLYFLATLEGPYNYGEELARHFEGQPVGEMHIRLLMKRYVIEKHGADAWLSDYDDLDFTDLFSEMNHFDGESVTNIIQSHSLVGEIKKELDQQGYSMKNKIGE